MWATENMTKPEMVDRVRNLNRIINEKNRELMELRRRLEQQNETIYDLRARLFELELGTGMSTADEH